MRRLLPPALIIASLARLALAHDEFSEPSGFNAFIDHNGITASAAMIAAALGLLAGAQGASTSRRAIPALCIGWILGSLLAPFLHIAIHPAIPSASVTILLGILIAIDRPLPKPFITLLAILGGLLHGYASTRAIADPHPIQIVCLALSAAALASLTASLALLARIPRSRIVLRVAGSWLAAIGLLMLGWSLRTNGG